MKRTVLTFLLSAASALHAAEPDITSRKVTDPLLQISSRTKLLPEKDDQSFRATRDEAHVPPVYRTLWNERNVILLEPFSEQKPAQIDFSAITKNNKGVLRLRARNHPQGDFELEILKDGQSFKKETVGANQWKRYTIPFDHESVVILNRANGWHFEFGFYAYTISQPR